MAYRDLARGWLVLSLVPFIILYNFLESPWLRAFDLLWLVFVFSLPKLPDTGSLFRR
jgi:hypothetical protein